MQKGKWKGKQIIPESFAKEATSAIVIEAEGNPLYKSYDYGYFWWRNPVNRQGEKHDVFMARGAGGQLIIVEPKTNLVVVTTAWNLTSPNKVQAIFDTYFTNIQ